MDTSELINVMALSELPGLGLNNACQLYKRVGSATAIIEHRNDILDILPDAHPRLREVLSNASGALARAEEELGFIEKNHIKALVIGEEDYPVRLAECEDAPLVIYYLGNTNLNAMKVVSIVGTRHCTEYGRSLCERLIKDLSQVYPDTLIVSGLAYGVDITAHRAALNNNMDSVGVLAHGLDTIYPNLHRHTASQMVHQGGLLTEYMSHCLISKGNFVRRNRIVAGMSDATIVVESAEKGGALITADIAFSYNRTVAAFPGKVDNPYSAGCHKLIHRNMATLITNADDLLELLQWTNPKSNNQPRQLELFDDLTDDERTIVNYMKDKDDVQVNNVVVATGLSYDKVMSSLLELEFKGVVKVLGGNRYKVLGVRH